VESYRLVHLLFTVAHAKNLFLEQLEQEFPFWKRLHGFWRTLPNFNPYTASSEPGQDLAADALALIWGRGQDNENDEEEDEAFGADDAQGGAINDEGEDNAIQPELVEVCRLTLSPAHVIITILTAGNSYC
jgi:hypothetical protein